MSRILPLVFLGAVLLSALPVSAACPKLEGQYWCVTGPEHFDILTIGHKVRADEVHVYSIDYSTIGGEPDYIYANATGVSDDFGWITKCTANGHLLSLRADGQALGEIYLDREGGFVRVYNEKIVQECPRKKSARVR